MHPEYAAVNGDAEDKYNRPKIYRVRWYTKPDNEEHEFDTASELLAAHMAYVKGGTWRTI